MSHVELPKPVRISSGFNLNDPDCEADHGWDEGYIQCLVDFVEGDVRHLGVADKAGDHQCRLVRGFPEVLADPVKSLASLTRFDAVFPSSRQPAHQGAEESGNQQAVGVFFDVVEERVFQGSG